MVEPDRLKKGDFKGYVWEHIPVLLFYSVINEGLI